MFCVPFSGCLTRLLRKALKNLEKYVKMCLKCVLFFVFIWNFRGRYVIIKQNADICAHILINMRGLFLRDY